MMSGRKNGSNILEYRTPLFSIKAVKSTGILDGSSSYSKFNPLVPDQKNKTPFGIITTIKSISKSAVERNKVRTRFKEAMRLALTRDLAASLPESGEGIGRDGPSGYAELPAGKSARTALGMTVLSFLIGYHFLATLTAGIYAEPMLTLVQQMRIAIADLARQAQNSGHAQKRFQTSNKPHAVKRARTPHQRI